MYFVHTSIMEVCRNYSQSLRTLVNQTRRLMDGVVAIIKIKKVIQNQKITDETCAGVILNRECRFPICRASGTSDRPWDDVSL